MSFAWNEKISAITTERLASGSRMVFGDDLSDIHHPCRSDIVAEWVNFQSAVTEEPINLGANANVIGIDIETTIPPTGSTSESNRLAWRGGSIDRRHARSGDLVSREYSHLARAVRTLEIVPACGALSGYPRNRTT
ncbi:hypothetical protein ACVWW2_002415 [Bradyrhizobium sp. LM4.3]